jgi:transposase InsO family protein
VKFAFIAAKMAEFPITVLCRVLEVSRAGFYASVGRPPSSRTVEDRRLRVLVREAHERSRRTYGSPRVHVELAESHGVFVSRKRVIRLMQEAGLRARARKRFKCCTVSDHDQPVAPNILDRKFEAEQPNQRWVGDTTELVTGNGKLFLAVILDLFAKYVVGWAVSPSNDRFLTMKALDMAIKRRCPDAGLLHHSDQGSTYASEDYQNVLASHGITCSMSRRGNVHDNAAMEAWNSTFKFECGERFETNAAAEEEVFDYIEGFYNPQRRHSAIGYMSPADCERRFRQRQEVAVA